MALYHIMEFLAVSINHSIYRAVVLIWDAQFRAAVLGTHTFLLFARTRHGLVAERQAQFGTRVVQIIDYLAPAGARVVLDVALVESLGD